MVQLTLYLFVSLFILSLVLFYMFYKQKKYLTALFCLSFCLKVILFFIMETGLKYTFVLDSLKYEMDAWNLMKAEVSNTKYIVDAFERSEYLNPFTSIIVNVFYIFGKTPQIVTLLNMFFSLGIYYFCIKIAVLLKGGVKNIQTHKSILLLACILFFYPSLNVWSVTNTKDPAALFFLVSSLYLLIDAKQKYTPERKLATFLIFVTSIVLIYLSHLFRPYILPVIAAGLPLGTLLYLMKKKVKLIPTLLIALGSAILGLYIIELTQPDLFFELGQNIYKARAGFLNEDWADDVSKSAFLVNYPFNSTLDYVLFLPQAITYYFLGPFFWQLKSMTEALGLFEVLFILLLMKSFWRGLVILTKKNLFEFYVLLSVFILVSLTQSFIISNMGTVFRHRTLSILIYLIIATVGFNFDKKEV
jgi:hypothetical protein